MNKTYFGNNQPLSHPAIVLPVTVTLPNNLNLPNTLSCETLLRCLPGKRLACLAKWGGQEVFAKLFIAPNHAKRDWLRDVGGTRALLDKGILTPALLYAGPILGSSEASVHAGSYLLIFTRIAPALTLLEAWHVAGEAERLHLLRMLIAVLAAHHGAGLLHGDLHFANFLVQDSKIFTLDGGQVEVRDVPAGKQRSLRNLGLFFAQLPPHYDTHAEDALRLYQSLRGWPGHATDANTLRTEIHAARTHRKNKYLRKIFRECSAFICRRNTRHFMVCDRAYDSVQLRQLLQDPDYFLNGTACKFIKRGNTATVGIIEIDGRSLVVKRYNIKGFWHGFSRALRRTRAAISWRNAHLLSLYGIATPKPVALLERRIGPLRGTGYFISEYATGANCADYFGMESTLQETYVSVADNLTKLFDKLAEAKISHGDLKATNIIIAHQPMLLDLDALRQHRSARAFKKAFARDVRRFLRNWDKDSGSYRLFYQCLAKFISG